jgi:hypothetical protein
LRFRPRWQARRPQTVRAFKGTRSQRITEYHISLDVLSREKTRGRLTEGLPLGSVLVTGAAAKVDIFAIGTVIVATMAAAEVVNRLSREGFRRESGPGNDDLAMFILISGIGSLEAGHLNFPTPALIFGRGRAMPQAGVIAGSATYWRERPEGCPGRYLGVPGRHTSIRRRWARSRSEGRPGPG